MAQDARYGRIVVGHPLTHCEIPSGAISAVFVRLMPVSTGRIPGPQNGLLTRANRALQSRAHSLATRPAACQYEAVLPTPVTSLAASVVMALISGCAPGAASRSPACSVQRAAVELLEPLPPELAGADRTMELCLVVDGQAHGCTEVVCGSQ